MGSVIPESRFERNHQVGGVKLNIKRQKDSAGGIKDDESILCATPPEYNEGHNT